MNSAELDQLFRQVATKIVSAEITDGRGTSPHGMSEETPRGVATLDSAEESDDGSKVRGAASRRGGKSV